VPIESIADLVKAIEGAFWRRYDANEAFRTALKGKDRAIHLNVKDGPSWRILVKDGRIVETGEGAPSVPDVVMTGTTEDILLVANGKLHPLRAYLERKVHVKAPLRDILLVKSFLS